MPHAGIGGIMNFVLQPWQLLVAYGQDPQPSRNSPMPTAVGNGERMLGSAV